MNTNIMECPYCNLQQGIRLSVTSGVKYENIIYQKCNNPKCDKSFMIPLNYKIIYLARTFECSDTRYKYPIHVKEFFSGVLDFIDPNDYKIEKQEDIIPLDLKLIDKCNILTALIYQPSFGTLGEMYYAKFKGIPIYIINPNRMYIEDPWVKYIATKVYDDIDKCYQDLTNQTVKEYNFR